MFTRRHKAGCIFIFISLISIFAIAFQPVSTSLLKPLERKYTAFLPPSESLDYVMVLGSGHVVDAEIPPTSELSRTALMRLSEGIRILRMYPGAKTHFIWIRWRFRNEPSTNDGNSRPSLRRGQI